MSIEDRAKKIKLLILDVDGVLTDGKIYYGNYGDELKAFDIRDGFGIALLRRAGIETVLITAKKSKIARLRAKDIGVRRVFENSNNKFTTVNKLVKRLGIGNDEVCFIGDDLLDIPVLKNIGLPVTVPHGAPEVKEIAQYTTKANGGSGAVREVCELILKSQGKWDEVTRKYFI